MELTGSFYTRYLTLLTVCCLPILEAVAQNAETIAAELKEINKSISSKAGSNFAAAVSNRAMNVFMADKTGYLSGSTDLSYYTNYTTFNSAEGKITVNHNFQPAAGNDDPIKTLFSIGFDMTLGNSYSKGFFDKRYENELGISLNYKWLGRIKTVFRDKEQQQAMDALRLALLQSLITGIQKKEVDFKNGLTVFDSAAMPGQDIAAAKKTVLANFYEEFKLAYEEDFAVKQAALLTRTGNFKRISTGWTSIAAYLPIVFPKYYTAALLTTPFSNKHPYAARVLLEHTRLWESSKTGRLFFGVGGNILFNNTKLSYGLNKLNYSEYRSLGGTAGPNGTDAGNNKLYIGSFQTFITAAASVRAVYFPRESHIGISVLAEQYFGKYDWLNMKLAIPVVLINSKKTPALTIECYLLFLNCSHQPATGSEPGKTQLGLSVGIPFSRLMF
jgi:hypothetical protein